MLPHWPTNTIMSQMTLFILYFLNVCLAVKIAYNCSITMQIKPLPIKTRWDWLFQQREKKSDGKEKRHAQNHQLKINGMKTSPWFVWTLKTENNLDSWDWLTHGWHSKKKKKKVRGGCPRDLTTRKREKPVAGSQPVSRQRMETILPWEKEEGSSAETQKQQSTF